MLELGSLHSRLCSSLSRRSFLRVGSLGILAGLSWADTLRAQSRLRETPRATGVSPVPKSPKHPSSPRAVIALWLWGGPSHIDLFDLKPNAPLEYRGPYQPISTSVPGTQISELLPKTAKLAHRFALIRSMVSGSNDHGVAGTIGLTGSMSGAIDLGGKASAGNVKPATGSIVAASRGHRPTCLPPYTILGSQLKQGHKLVVGEGAGLLGSRFDPFRLEYSLEDGVQIPDVALRDGLTPDALRSRWDLLKKLDATADARLSATPVRSMDRYYDLALSLITSGVAREVLELRREPDSTRDAYGMTRFGQCCLLARRLVETGIPYVQVNWSTHVEPYEDAGDGGWDMHDRNFQQLQDRHSWILDQAYSALLDDLDRRGLLDSTLVVALGEFGRTPKINNKAGRDHWPHCYSALLAGAGIPGGAVVGSSDQRAEHPAVRPVTPADLSATLLDRLAITTPDLTSLGLTPQGTPIDELL